MAGDALIMFLEGGGQFFVEADRFGQCIEEDFGVSAIQAHGFVLVNGFFSMSQRTGQYEITDGLAFKARGALQRILGTGLQPEIDTVLSGVCSDAHDEFSSAKWTILL